MVKNVRAWILSNCRFAATDRAVTASIVVLKKDDDSDFKVLIARRKADPEAGKWALPGGHIEPNESPDEGAKRELLEETGIHARQLIRISDKIIETESASEKERLDIVYATMVTSDTDAVAGSDSAAVRWVPVNDLPELAFDHANAIRTAVEKLMRQDKQAAKIKNGNNKGILIAIEGIDGSGKSTLADRLLDWFDDQDYPITHTKWNDSDFISDAIKNCKDERCLSPMLFCLLHAADFVWRYDNVIIPALERNHIVLCDRYFYTSYVRDGIRGTDTEILDKAYKDMREPDVLFHCTLPVELAYSRVLAEKGFTFYGSGMDMGLSKNREESCMKYEGLMDKEYKKLLPKQKNYVKLDTNRSEKEVFKAAKKELADRFGIGGFE